MHPILRERPRQWTRSTSCSGAATCLEDSLNGAGVAGNIAARINASNANCTASTGGTQSNEIFITLKAGAAGPVALSAYLPPAKVAFSGILTLSGGPR